MQGRQLGLFHAVMLVMGGVLGVGVFFNPARIAELVPHEGAFLALWVVGGVIALAGAAVFAELGGSLPQAGGWYVFLRTAFGPGVAFLFAWVVLGVITPGSIAVMVGFGVRSLNGWFPQLAEPDSPAALTTGALVLIAAHAAALRGVRAGAALQSTIMVFKIAVALAIVGAAFLVFDAPARAAGATAPELPALPTLGTFGAALLPVLFACGGWQHLCYLASEVREPSRTLPRALLLGAGGIVVLYLLLNAAYLHVLGSAGLAGRPLFASELIATLFGPHAGPWLSACLAVSALGVALVTIIATPWLYVAMAREGLFFARFGALAPRTGAPSTALCAQAVLCLVYWFAGSLTALVDAVVAVEWCFHVLAAVALLRLRARRPELPRPFVSPLYPLAPLVYLGLALFAVASSLQPAQFETTRTGFYVLAAGLVVYKPWRALVARRERMA